MKITVINNSSTAVPCVDGTQCEAGATHEMPGRVAADITYMMAFASGNDVIIEVELEAMDRSPIVCTMKKPADPAGGVVELAGVGFDLLTQAGAAANVDPQMYMGAFDDAACTIPSVDAVLDTATSGTIDDGTGTNLIKVTPTAAGVFACKVTVTAPAAVHLKAWPVGSDYAIDNSDSDVVTFTP